MLLFTSASVLAVPMVLRHGTGDWIERRRVRYLGGFARDQIRCRRRRRTQDVIYRRKTWLLPKNTPPLYKHPRHFCVGCARMYIIHSPECPTTTVGFFIAKLSARADCVEINVLEFAVPAS